MNHIDGNLDVTTYFKESLRTVDGLAWLAVSIASVLRLIDIFLGINLIPLRNAAKPDMEIILLFLTPVTVFAVLIQARLSSWAKYRASSVLRAILCIAAFLVINF